MNRYGHQNNRMHGYPVFASGPLVYGGVPPLSYSGMRVPVAAPSQPNQLEQSMGVNSFLKDFDVNPVAARFFVIKSYTADDVHKAMKYGVWTSTKHGNKRLDDAYAEFHSAGPIYLLFSVNGSGCFCGMARMDSALDYDNQFGAWSQGDKWSGQFKVTWLFIKNIPNKLFTHIRLANNSNKPVTNSRDTQEVFLEEGKKVVKIFAEYEHTYSLLDEFAQYDMLELEMKAMKERMKERGQQFVNQPMQQQPTSYYGQRNQNRGTRRGRGRGGRNRGRGRGGRSRRDRHGKNKSNGENTESEKTPVQPQIMSRPKPNEASDTSNNDMNGSANTGENISGDTIASSTSISTSTSSSTSITGSEVIRESNTNASSSLNQEVIPVSSNDDTANEQPQENQQDNGAPAN